MSDLAPSEVRELLEEAGAEAIAFLGIGKCASFCEVGRACFRGPCECKEDAVRVLDALSRVLFPGEPCETCGGKRRVVMVSMDRVEAGIGPPRPTYVDCPDCRPGLPALVSYAIDACGVDAVIDTLIQRGALADEGTVDLQRPPCEHPGGGPDGVCAHCDSTVPQPTAQLLRRVSSPGREPTMNKETGEQ